MLSPTLTPAAIRLDEAGSDPSQDFLIPCQADTRRASTIEILVNVLVEKEDQFFQLLSAQVCVVNRGFVDP
jgi:hypothetical protein